jgi:AraC-like DNA-binding protein
VNVIIGHALYEARAGDWLIVRSDVPHGEFCVQSRAGFRTIWFGCWSKDLYPLSMSRYSRVRGYGFDWYSRISKSAAPAFDMAMETVLANPNQRRALLQLNLARLAMWWLETLDAASDRPDKTSYPLVNEIWSILKAGKGRPPSVSKLARGVGLSRGHLSKLFHAYTGQTLRRSILENRLDNARRYLARPTLPIKEISYLLGFASPQHFCHTFRQFVGVSPTVFRRNLRGQRSKR